ncbi:hypothetical protein QRX60_15145 [Amycolatopsis mongoliensis]|uniref:Uncharacterized protein n=1 Tax=Amycolatopsis mongoliensis TaxID=715475 RepID=A0A9Y2JUY0_9PSEU|nr:hypothetical protein [Amycolatopsis sp. 4-36]WIY05105.1 hypothetical protein QRX60_15145 [Amycolatopsis sp. 4-36]
MSAELFFKLVSIAIVAGYVVVVRKARLPRAQEFLLLALALASPVFFLQLYLGLETASFALLIAWLYGMLHRRGKLGPLGFVVAAALAVSRPEGIVFSGVAIAWALLIDRRDKATWRGAVFVLGGWVAYWCLRWWYFGQFFPNTYYKKTTDHIPALQKLADLSLAIAPLLVPVLMGIAICVAWYRRTAATRTSSLADLLRDAVPLLLSVVAAFVVLGVYRPSNLVMDPGHRFYWQLLFPVALVALSRPITRSAGGNDGSDSQRRNLTLLGLALATVTALVWDLAQPTNAIVVGAGIVAAAVVVGVSRRTHVAVLAAAVGLATVVGFGQPRDLLSQLAYRYRLESAHQALGAAVAATKLPPGAIVVGDVGVFPYQVGNQVIDISGLGTVEAAHGTLDAGFLDRSNVKLVVLISSGPDPDEVRSIDLSGVAYDWVTAKGPSFVAGSGPVFASKYHLNYWMSKDWADAGLQQKFEAAYRASVPNEASDAVILRRHLADFPFLSGMG